MTGKTIAMLCAIALCGFVASSASPWAKVVLIEPAKERTVAPRTPRTPPAVIPEGFAMTLRCEGAAILSRDLGDGERMFYAIFDPALRDRMIHEGCMQVVQGCNVCNVTYTGCSAAERAACTDGDCLAKTCERKVVCSAKHCTAQGTKAPPCTSRFARHACIGGNALDAKAR